ncbi:MAG: HAD-IIA family hydrolase [Kocuria sp.]|nr:HAD-IIA family hydrolase [Kocuria sp.]
MSNERLIDRFDAVLSDLDGVVYAGPHAIPAAPEAFQRLETEKIPVVFVTNNASRSVEHVAEHLRKLGVPTSADRVVSSAQAAADVLKNRLEEGSRILVTGSSSLAQIIREAGMYPVWSQQDYPHAVVQGFDPGIGWKDLAEAAFALANPDVLWVATNTDASIPQARGIAPGNGTLVAAVASATRRHPIVAGKPEAAIFQVAAQRVQTHRPVVVGDRLDTDILGGNRAGFATIAVLTGIDTPETILGATTPERPQIMINTLEDLFHPVPMAQVVASTNRTDGAASSMVEARCGDAMARAAAEHVNITGDRQDLNAWRAACAAWWTLKPQVSEAKVPQISWEIP